jgi:hypothetical protein
VIPWLFGQAPQQIETLLALVTVGKTALTVLNSPSLLIDLITGMGLASK